MALDSLLLPPCAKIIDVNTVALLHVKQKEEHLLDFPMCPFQIGDTWAQVIPTYINMRT